MTYEVLKVDEIGYDTVEINTNGDDILFSVDNISPSEAQFIKIPLADWPEVKSFIDSIYQKFAP